MSEEAETETFTGERPEFDAVDPGRFELQAIGRGLGNLCVLQGRPRRFYSIAELALQSLPRLREQEMLHGLLYPAPAAIMGDAPPAVHGWLATPRLRELENSLRAAAYRHLGLNPPSTSVSERVREAREHTLAMVESHLLNNAPMQDGRLLCLAPDKAAAAWIRAAELLLGDQLEKRLSAYYSLMRPGAGDANEP